MTTATAVDTNQNANSSRDPVNRITDEMIMTPIGKLTPAQRAMIRRAINGDRSEEFLARCTSRTPTTT